MAKKCLIIVYSYHHNNTKKVAQKMSEVLNADVITPVEVQSYDLSEYDLIGFGAGIDSGKHYKPLIDCVQTMNLQKEQKAFIFSTSGVQGQKKVYKDHTALRDILLNKKATILGEFSCKGFNTNLFLKYFGGMNKEHPTSEDLQNAQLFSENLLTTF